MLRGSYLVDMTRPVTPEPLDPPARALRLGGLLALAAILVIGGGVALDRWRDSTNSGLDSASLQPWFGPATFAVAVSASDQTIAGRRETLALAPAEWTSGESLALALIARWRLTGDYADLAEAQRLLDAGVAKTSGPSGPLIAAAALGVLVHRLDQADAALARFAGAVAPETREVAEAAALAGDVALQRGQLDAARVKFALAVQIAPPPGGDLRLAFLPAMRGDPDRAAAELEPLLAVPRQQPAALATLMLRRAQLDLWRGDWAGAGRWVGAAQRAFPGWWIADAHAAQQFALAGRTDDAIRAYTIVAKRSGRPEVMDALAHLLRLQGQGAASRAWAARAAAGWEARAALFPEAVIQHRAEHELAVGSVTKALTLAETDVAARPGPQGIALLARALILSGRSGEALRWLDRSRDAGFVTAGALMLRAEAEAALGDGAASEAARDQALAINPRAADPASRTIWFGHD